MPVKIRQLIARAGMAAGLMAVGGCASVDPSPDYESAREAIEETSGVETRFDPEDEASAAAAVDELLRDGVSIRESLSIALLNNPSLQAAYFRVGMSRADFVQSGLFSNPTLALSFAFPEGGGRSNIQGTLAQNIVDLWQIPIRKRIARAKLEQEILALAQQAARLVIDTKIAYYAAIAADRQSSIAQTNLTVAGGLLDTTLARQKAGTVGELDVNLARGTLLNTELEVQTARLDASNARRRLATLLGLTENADALVLSDDLTEAPWTDLDEEAVVELARACRLDLRAARQAVEAGRERVSEEVAKIFPDIALGTYFERLERRALPGRDVLADTARASVAAGQLTAPDIQSRGERNAERRQEIDTILGPALTMTLPIFDQNQAQIAKADYAYRAAVKEMIALDRAIVQDARRGLDQAATATKLHQFYEEKILPQATKSLELGDMSYKSGKTTLITVLDAQRNLLSTRRMAVTARQAAATAVAELEWTVARPMTAIIAETGPGVSATELESSPTTQPATAEGER